MVSHEYASPFLIFRGLNIEIHREKMTDDQIHTVMASTGLSIVEIARRDCAWTVEKDSPFNRRIHLATPMAISGPAAGDDRLKTSADPTGTKVIGIISTCNGGITPWGTILSGDDDDFEYLCRFVTRAPRNQDDRAANRDLLEHGTLSVAQFAADGCLRCCRWWRAKAR